METVSDFEDLLAALGQHDVRYLIIGGLAFIYHAKPRYTQDLDLWIDPDPENVDRANAALTEFGSPHLLSTGERQEILQLALPPNRIDLMCETGDADFDEAWRKREDAAYGAVAAHWIGLDALIFIKRQINHPRHQEDVRVLEAVKRRREGREDQASGPEAASTRCCIWLSRAIGCATAGSCLGRPLGRSNGECYRSFSTAVLLCPIDRCA